MIQLTAPDTQPNFYGFAPEPRPQLIAWSPTESPALSLSRGLERDRGVDETGHQIAIFGRIGSRPFTLDEMKQFYMGPDGRPYTVTDVVQQQDFVPAAHRARPPAAPAMPAPGPMPAPSGPVIPGRPPDTPTP